MNLAMDLAPLCEICGGKNGINGCHLTVYSEDIALAHHLMATCHPHSPTL